MKVKCPFRICEHEFEAVSTTTVNPRLGDNQAALRLNKYGRETTCPKCGEKILLTRQANTKHGAVHMSKKARLKMRREHGQIRAETPKLLDSHVS